MLRLIARLDIKGPNLIKGVHLEGLRVIGDPQAHATRYYQEGIDELLYVDLVASLYGRNNLTEIVQYAAENVFIPLTVAGGIRTCEDIDRVLRAGADKVAVNTAAIRRPSLITEVARHFGSQCMILSIEANSVGPGRWEALINNGRDRTGIDVLDWARRGVDLGAGEILLTSIDREGTRRGFDVDLTRAVSTEVPIPVIASGGMGSAQHLVDVATRGRADAVAIADLLHYRRMTVADVRAAATSAGLEVRTP